MSTDRRSSQTASHWGVYTVETGPDGRIMTTTPYHSDPHPSRYVNALPEIVRHTLRIDQPYVRTGFLKGRRRSCRRGADSYTPVTWKTAVKLAAEELARVRTQFGNEAIYGGSYGWASAGRFHHGPSVLKRFLGLHGGYTDKTGNHSYGAAMAIMPHVIGRADIANLVVSWPEVVAETRLVVLFGGAPLKNTQIDAGGAVVHENDDWFHRAAKAGIRFVNISPSRLDLPEGLAGEWLPIRPNTDTALMLGLAHTLIVETLHDPYFLSRYCVGYEHLEAYILGRDSGHARSADWAASITGIPAEQIRSLARRISATRTLIATSWSVQRADHGEQPVWMTVALAALLGQIGLPGGGFSLGFGAVNGTTTPRVRGMPRPTLPLGNNPIPTRIPIGRLSDALLNPGSQIDYDGEIITFPDIRLIHTIGGNPFHHNANLNRFLEAWQRPETIIVHDPWWTPATRHADIVFPSTTTLERNDILAQEHQPYWLAMQKAIEPVGAARNDFDVLADMADRLGFGAAYTEGRDELGWLRSLYDHARDRAHAAGFDPPDFDSFWREGQYAFPTPEVPDVLFSAFRAQPDAFPLETPSGRIELYSRTLERFGYEDCPPHPAWLEPAEWLGAAAVERFPLHLLSNQPSTRLHSQLDPASPSRNSKIHGREPLMIHPLDAAARQIRAGDVVRVFNDRGAFLAGAVLVDHLRPGVLQIATGAWYDPLQGGVVGSLEKHGNPNVVTLDKGTSKLAQGSVAQTVLVQAEKYPGTPPPVTAFDLPHLVECS